MNRRRAPATLDCPHFGRCGGCSRLDQPIAEQIADKVAAVAGSLAPFLPHGLPIVEGLPALDRDGGPPRYDRTKLSWPVARGRGGRIALGLYARGTHDLVRVRRCEIQHPVLTELGRAAEQILDRAGLEPWDETRPAAEPRSERLQVRAFSARIAPGTGEMLLGVTTTGGRWDGARKVADALFDAAENLCSTWNTRGAGPEVRPVGVVRNLNDKPGNVLLGRRQLALRGRDHQFDHADGMWFRITFGCFYQVHRHADRLLYQPAMQACGSLTGKTVVDAYGGVGTFALRMLRRGAARVRLVENNTRACADALASAARNRVDDRLEVVEGKTDAQQALFDGVDLVLVDPPRSGLGVEVATALAAAAPPRIVYVACSHRALARDLEILVGERAAGGQRGPYDVASVQTCDLFPHTEHTEVICVLERR